MDQRIPKGYSPLSTLVNVFPQDVSPVRNRHLLVVAFLAMSLSACGNGDDPFVGGQSVTPDGGSAGDCRHVLDSDITSPTQLVNGPDYCDYLLTDWIEIRSLLSIEPGTVIRASADERIRVDGGELRAIGTADQRIVFEGLASVQGYWRGIEISEARNVVMDHVDIKDAGQVCTSLFCPDVGFLVNDTTLSFTNSSVSNSYVHGMSIGSGVRIDAFSNNRFYGNSLAGLNMDIELMPELDSGSDYYGLDAANGSPYVGVISGGQESGAVFKWKALNAPYLIDSYLHVEGGIMQLDPGVEIVFGRQAWMTVKGNGVLKALGTAADPIIFRGAQATPGYWDGIRMSDTNFDTNILQHTTLSHSGDTDSLLSAYAALRLDESFITITNSTFSDNARWGIYCTEPDSATNASVIVDGGGNSFINNASGALPTNCSIR